MGVVEIGIDSLDRAAEVQEILKNKFVLRALYLETYGRFKEVLHRCPVDGMALELGSGAGFANELIPDLVTSDILTYPGVDRVVDATRMPFGDDSLRGIFLNNVLHHIPDAEAFFREASRCLKTGGRICIEDHNLGWISTPVLKYVHHEPYDSKASEWKFETTGPLSGANAALPWIIFERDRKKFAALFPELEIVSYKSHTPLRYWMTGGLKPWSLMPRFLFAAATMFDNWLVRQSPKWGSFINIELKKVAPSPSV